MTARVISILMQCQYEFVHCEPSGIAIGWMCCFDAFFIQFNTLHTAQTHNVCAHTWEKIENCPKLLCSSVQQCTETSTTQNLFERMKWKKKEEKTELKEEEFELEADDLATRKKIPSRQKCRQSNNEVEIYFIAIRAEHVVHGSKNERNSAATIRCYTLCIE